MKKILLIQQYLGKNSEVGPIFPIGLAYLATSIEQKTNWKIRVLDMNLPDKPYTVLEQTLCDYQPHVAALSIRNIDNVDYDEFNYFYLELQKIFRTIKRHNCILMVGGAGFSIFARVIFERHNEIDYGMVQEGEETIVELLLALEKKEITVSGIKGLYYRDDGKIYFTGFRSPIKFSDSPIPNRDYFDMSRYQRPLCIGVQTKRGCSLHCSYCVYPYLQMNIERFRSPYSVVDEIEQLINRYNVKEIIFCDDIFNVPIEHCQSILFEILNRKIKIKWSAWFDVANTDLDFMRLAIRAGCYRFCFSIEGVTDKSLRLLHKNFNAAQATKIINLCSKKEFKNIDFRFSLFALPPGQSLFGILKTICLVFRIHVIRLNNKCLVSWIRILPNTELYNKMKTNNIELLPENMNETKKKDIFWVDHRFPNWFICCYRYILHSFILLRKWRKKYIINY